MAGTFSKLLYHIIFSTKGREPSITPGIEPRLYEYIGGIVRSENSTALRIGGVADHIHILLRGRTDQTLAELMRIVKSKSSLWIHQTFPDARNFAWQEGYAVFTVSESQKLAVDRYIANQHEHHRTQTFEQELIQSLEFHAVDYDPKYALA